jgi:predicted oxidoreductase
VQSYNIPQTDLLVSRIAFGTGHLGGGWDDEPIEATTITDARRLIHCAFDQGITIFDLADVYCFGKSELAFGQVVKHSPELRKDISVQSKCGIRVNHSSNSNAPWYIDSSHQHIINSVEGSLRRLHTDYLDILLLHHPDPLLQPEEVATAFDTLKSSGKVRYFGVSNFNASQLALLQTYVRQPLVVNQVSLSLINHHPITEGNSTSLSVARQAPYSASKYEGGIADYCQLNKMQIQAYSPLRDIRFNDGASANATPEMKRIVQQLAEIAREKDASPASIALAWLLKHPAGILPIVETHNSAHLIENCVADRVTLSHAEWYMLWMTATNLKEAPTS